jgi:hypothetical protein
LKLFIRILKWLILKHVSLELIRQAKFTDFKKSGVLRRDSDIASSYRYLLSSFKTAAAYLP